jgi:hypothetical protein
MNTLNIYCDESCHLEHDGQKAMVLGAVWCPLESAQDCSHRVREIKVSHGLKPDLEIKWTKVSPAGVKLYLDLVDYFFDCSQLGFRGVIIPDKTKLRHEEFGQDHDLWYYKMYFTLLKAIISPDKRYRIYIDIKDTQGTRKVEKLHEVLCNSNYDFRCEIVERVQQIRSEESALIQLADLIIGALSYVNRGLSGNAGKEAVVRRVRERSGYRLDRTTLLQEPKLNLLIWRGRGED